mgnify:FL=1
MKLCSIASGSSGNCIFAGSETTSLLIDAGISGKRVEAGLAVLDRSAKELDGILVTHEHSDHIQGLGVLARRYGIPIYATDGTIQAMQQTKSLGKFPEGIFHTIHADDTFTLGDIAVHPFTISTMRQSRSATEWNPAGNRLRLRRILAFTAITRFRI